MAESESTQPEESKQSSAGEREPGEEAKPMDVWGLLHYCLLLLHSYAWQAMGFVPDPATGKIAKDLEQARVAIDAASNLAGQLETRLCGRPLHDLRALVADLRLNFVQQQRAQTGE